MKFVLYIDYKKGGNYSYEAMTAKTLEEAIEEADKVWNEKEGTIYLMRIMKKVGNIVTPYKAGYKFEEYEATMCRRSYGWHLNTTENSEGVHKVNKCWLTSNKNEIWYEIA